MIYSGADTAMRKMSRTDFVSAIGSTEIADDSIVDADVNSAAAITRSKLASGTASRVLVNDGSGVMSESATIDSTELGFLDGVSSNIQTQLDGKEASLGYTPVNKAGDNMSGPLTIAGTADAVQMSVQANAG